MNLVKGVAASERARGWPVTDEVNREEYVKILKQEMEEAAETLDFERAAVLRDQLFELEAVE